VQTEKSETEYSNDYLADRCFSLESFNMEDCECSHCKKISFCSGSEWRHYVPSLATLHTGYYYTLPVIIALGRVSIESRYMTTYSHTNTQEK